MRTIEEIAERVWALRGSNADFFGFESADLIVRLPFDQASPYLRAGVTREEWEPRPRDHASVLKALESDLIEAFRAANDCQGNSAFRAMSRLKATLWLLGEDEAAEELEGYTYYGKPQLRAVCDHYGLDWRQHDNGKWRKSEDYPPKRAEDVPLVNLSWKSEGASDGNHETADAGVR